jgi:predicted DNA-binding protein
MTENKNRENHLSVVLNDHELEMLEKMCEELHRTKSEMVRELIRQEYEGRFGKG